jgi:3-hydroxyisobutyrate dehydrogenase-like beta-hydroxyacid dehydrogenase
MKKVGVIGLGNMGMGMAKNLIKSGFSVIGFDLDDKRLLKLKENGGSTATSTVQVGEKTDAVFVMVMNGEQVKAVVSDLVTVLKDRGTIILTSTITPEEAREAYAIADIEGVAMLDSPVSGGMDGAHNGTLTLMTAAKKSVFDDCIKILEAVSSNIFHVGEEIGEGQTVKASLQVFIGASFTAIFESLVLGSKAGIKGQILYDVFSASGVGSPLFKNTAALIMDRKFKNTGSHIFTMYKDLGISLNMAKKNGVPLFTAGAAYELFQAGISMFPDEDNWSIVKLLEQVSGTEVHW